MKLLSKIVLLTVLIIVIVLITSLMAWNSNAVKEVRVGSVKSIDKDAGVASDQSNQPSEKSEPQVIRIELGDAAKDRISSGRSHNTGAVKLAMLTIKAGEATSLGVVEIS